MISNTNFVYDYWYFQLAYLNFRPLVNVVFDFFFCSLNLWNDERTKIIFLTTFQLVTGLNSENRNETCLLMNSDTLICIWILEFPIGIIQVSHPRKWIFLFYFSSLHDYWPPTTLNSLVHNSLGVMEWCEKRFSSSQNAKNESQLKHKIQVRNSSFNDS